MGNRQRFMKLLLVVLLGIWVVVIAYRFNASEPPQRALLTHVQDKATGSASTGRDGGELILRLDLLDKSRQVEWTQPKNIFAPVEIYRPPPPPPVVPQVHIPTPEEIAAERARQELSQFRVLGYLNKGDREEVFLARGGELFIAHQGELIQGQYFLKELGSGRVVLQDRATNVEVTIVVSSP
jgi:hypothetical protein